MANPDVEGKITDRFGRPIDYLRISVTDRCNLRCLYCMPLEGVRFIEHNRIMSYEEIVEVVQVAVALGFRKFRLTGGEPLVRRGIVSLVSMLSEAAGGNDLAMTTNGVLLADFAEPLKKAGLRRVNISLDTLDPLLFKKMTRGGDLNRVLEGVSAAESAGLTPIKLNCVVKQSSSEPDARAVAEFGESRGYIVRFIRRMNIRAGEFSVLEGGTAGDCALCNRLRLSSDGYIRPCLFNDVTFNVRELGARDAILQAVAAKPESGSFSLNNKMYNVGG